MGVPALSQQPALSGIFNFEDRRLPVASLDGLWRFHAGDDPLFATPALDDSSWPLVRSERTWADQHLPLESGTFWYRTKVEVPIGRPPLSIYVPRLDVNYQVFCDGRLIGGVGAMPPHAHINNGRASTFSLTLDPRPQYPDPGRLGSSANLQTITLAIRIWRWRVEDPAVVTGLTKGMLIGDTSLIQEPLLLRARTVFWKTSSSLFLTLLGSLATAAAIGLYFLRRQEREYLWYSLVSLLSVLKQINFRWTASHAFDWPAHVLRTDLLEEAYALALMMFIYQLLRVRRSFLFWAAVCAICVDFVLTIVDMVPWIISPDWLLVDTAIFNGLHGTLFLPFVVWVPFEVMRKAAEGRVEARILLPAVTLESISSFLGFYVVSLSSLAGLHFPQTWFLSTSLWPIPFSIPNLADLLTLLSMLCVLVFRFTRTRLREDTYERERAAARDVQRILIPNDLPKIPGFEIASVYRPFGEVGGDFFHILPVESGPRAGSVMIVIGDVSGKGLPAAMTVSLLVGAIGTLAHYTQSPTEVLSAINERMLKRSSGGFTTCLVLRVDRDGTLTVANAGHIAPYLRGEELSLVNGLPLGLVSDSEYIESAFHLSNNEQITLMTDGVVEARSKSGELFGFERTRSISEHSAVSIADIAQNFGQDDDITVLSICLQRASSL